MISRLVVQNPDDSVEIATRSSHLANLREYDNLEIQRTQALQDLNQLDAQQILYQEAFDEIENSDAGTDLRASGNPVVRHIYETYDTYGERAANSMYQRYYQFMITRQNYMQHAEEDVNELTQQMDSLGVTYSGVESGGSAPPFHEAEVNISAPQRPTVPHLNVFRAQAFGNPNTTQYI